MEKRMRIAVCDDSSKDRGALRALLNACGHDFEIREYASGVALCGDMGFIRECGIVFLDINMDGTDGLETARRIKAECPKVHIVLVTAYVDYALDGYKVKASRFLLKDDLERTLSECVEDILQEIRQEEQMVEFGFVEGNVRLRVSDIIYIETNRHKNVFYTTGQTYSIYKKLDELERELTGTGFARVHQSFLVNMRYIEKISSYVMVLTTGKEISVPKSRYPEVKRQYTLFKGGGVMTGWKTWVLFLTIIMESLGSAFFFDIFLGKGKTEKCTIYQYRFAAYLVMTFALTNIGYLIGMWVPLFALGYVLLGRVIYKVGWGQDLFFSMINYSMMFLIDFAAYCLMHVWGMQETAGEVKEWVWIFSAKGLWFAVLFILRRLWKGGGDYSELTNGEWVKLSMIPLFTLLAILMMFYQYGGAAGAQMVSIFISAGLVTVSFFVIWLLREILEKGKKLREGMESARKTESQLAHYRDMQAVYERQGRKLHDYKNQIRTMQVLLKEDNTQEAAALAERLTESISMEMAAVNTNHPVVNAVLNQKFHAAREQGVSMIFKVGDMGGLKLNEEETVILLSNLLDNAIRECAKVVQEGRKAVISIKLVQEDGRMICSIKNPVAKKVQITDGIMLDSDGGMHGVGLVNVKALADQYGGDFAVSCDEEKFRVVVIL